MFTLTDISTAHARVKSGADFPQFARDLITLWVTTYDTYVSDGHAVYLGNPEPLISESKYEEKEISHEVKKDQFIERLRLHQGGGTDYMTFCQDAADAWVEKWTLDMQAKTCTYFDGNGNELIIEHFGE